MSNEIEQKRYFHLWDLALHILNPIETSNLPNRPSDLKAASPTPWTDLRFVQTLGRGAISRIPTYCSPKKNRDSSITMTMQRPPRQESGKNLAQSIELESLLRF